MHFLLQKPTGKIILRMCTSAPCHLAKAENTLAAVCDALGIRPGETTADGEFTLLTSGCIGACAQAPAILVNEMLYGPVYENDVPEFLEMLRKGEMPCVK